MPTMSPNKDVQKTAQDWVRDLRFSNQVNMQTMGVDTDRVTPQLLLASSNKLLGISKGQQEGDMKDSLQFQRFYGPVEYFAERIQKDGGSVARSMLWKATNRGNLDFIGAGSLQPHVNAVFHESNLSQFVDNSTPIDGIDNSQKVTRIGEGGLSDEDSAPIEMRLVQPSYYGYVDPIRTAEKSPGITGYLTKNVLKGTDGKLYQKFINMHTGKEELVDAQTAAKSIVTTDEYLDSKDDYVYAIGGPRGLRIVKRSDVDYILPHSDDAFSASANTVPMLSGIKAMRLLMGCHHPETPVAVVDSNGYTHIVPAKRLGHMGQIYVLGCDKKGRDEIYAVRKVITRVPAKKSKFKKVILSSGRVLLTSAEHKWWVYNEKFQLKQAKDLQEGMLVPRSLFSSMPVRLTEIMGTPVTREICVFMGRLIRSLRATTYSYRVDFVKDKERGVDQSTDITVALEQLGIKNYNLFHSRGIHAVSIKDPVFEDWVNQNVGMLPEDRKIPSEILSLPEGYTSIFLDSYYKDLQTIGQDSQGDTWLLSIANPALRDSLSFMLNKIYTDTKYRDYTKKDFVHRALELVPASTSIGDVVLEKITKILDVQAPPVMIDIDCDDNVYAVANGIITHNSKYVSQAVPLQQREAPLVRGFDAATGMDMATKMGKLLGTQWAPKSGMVKAVREDRIDMVYDDGTTGSVPLYKNFPSNAKGWLTNYPKVKAGDKVGKGQLLAASNYTDDNGVLAMGRNLRMAYMSYHGGTYEDACILSQSAAKKLGYTTMYKTDMDKDKSIRTAKHLYTAWKPGKFTKEQLQNLDDQGVVKVGATINKGDPVILGIRTTEPSPGTLGKRILSDVTEVWEHANPGVVTDVVNGKNGIKVFATVSSPFKEGDKLSNAFGGKGTVAQVIPDDMMPKDSKGRPLELLYDPLGIVSRCYDDQTEFLTKDGWKFGKDVLDADMLYSYDPHTNTCRWSKQTDKFYKKFFIGMLYGYKNKLTDFLVTEGHKVWTRSQYSDKWYQTKIQDIFGTRCQLPIIADPSQKYKARDFKLSAIKGLKMTAKEEARPCTFKAKDWAQFLGWYLSEGHFAISDRYAVYISQDGQINPAKCWRIQSLLKRMGVSFNYSTSSCRFEIYGKRLALYLSQFGKCDQKFIPQWLFKQPWSVVKRFISGLMQGDGKVSKKECNNKVSYSVAISLTSQKLIDQLQALLATFGVASTKHFEAPDKRYDNAKPMYRLGISTTKRQTRSLRDGWYMIDYRGMVYCPSVETGYVLTRRHGCLICMGNTNPSQMMEVGLGKVAAKTGKPIVVPAFMPKGQSRLKYVKDLMKANNVPWKEDVFDPESGRTIKNVFTGVGYYYPLKHIADTKMSARGTAQYTAQQVPMGGGQQGSKKIGNLEVSGLVGHNAFNFLHDAKLIRGQANSDFWRSIRTGQIPTVPGEPLAHKKFFAHLQGSGMQIKRDNEGFTIFALSNKDVNELAGSRQLKSTDTYQQKSFRPIAGGLFGQDIFGPDGDKWAYIQLDSPLPNPVMQEPLARLLGISDTEFQQIVRGKGTQKDLHNAVDMKKKLSAMDLEKQANRALAELKTSTKSQKDKALKKYVAIARMRDAGVRPQEYMLDRIPVLPPKFRPITSHGGLTMVADSNYLYSQLLNARDDLREAKDLPEEYQEQGLSNLYSKWKELVGLYDPSDVKLKSKNVKGLLKWALGSNGPKFSAYMQKVLGSTVDTVGRGVIIPSTKIKLNQVGLPIEMAWNLYSPFVVRKLVQQGYSPVDAMQQVKERRPVAAEALSEAIQERPVVLNRAPSLHKLSLIGLNVKLTSGHAIKVNPSIDPPLAADHDGDSVLNTTRIVIDSEDYKAIFEDYAKKSLDKIQDGYRLSSKAPMVGCHLNKGEDNMFGKETSTRLIQCSMALSEIPRKEGSEVKKSETVTEWEPARNTYVPTIDPATGETTVAQMTKISKHTGLKMFDCKLGISTSYAHIVTASEDHSLITLNPTTLELEKTRPEDAKGRCVPRMFITPVNHWESCAKNIVLDKQYPLSYEMGVFIGTMIGDGWVDANGYSFVACCDESFQKYISEHFVPSTSMPFTKQAKLYKYEADEQRFSKNDKCRFSIYMDHKAHWALKEKIGSGAYNKKIPWESMMGSKAHMIGVLVGLFATDGHIGVHKATTKKSSNKVIAYHTTSQLLRDGIQDMCLRLGVKTYVTPYMGPNSKATCYAISFSLEDIAKLKKEHPDLFVLPVEHKEEALKQICAEIYKGMQTSYDIVPFPRGIFCECCYAKVSEIAENMVISARKKGFIRRDVAKKIADRLEGADWKNYMDMPYIKNSDRTHHTPSEALALVNKWIAMVRNEDIGWEVVEDVTPSTCTEGWDCTVPGPYTFSLSTGTVVQDTVNIHVPVSKKAIQDVRQKMMPERNLISLRKGSILYGPEKGYVQGLYVATRMGESKDVKTFETTADARKAYLKGQIDIDTPIVIKEK